MDVKKTQFVEKKQNSQKNLILKELYYNESLSGSEISKKIRVSFPTVTRFIGELIDKKLVIDKGIGESIGGRRPGLYGINPDSGYVLSMDIRRDVIRLALYDMLNTQRGNLVEFSIDGLSDKRIYELMYEHIDNCFSKNQLDKSKLAAIGLSVTGLINLQTGKNISFLNSGDKTLQDILGERYNIPVFIDNDASAMAMGEQAFGKAHNIANALIVNVGWGIGMGMILNHVLYKGKSGFSGEFGHIPIEGANDLCYCGKKGCLETQASGKAMVKNAVERIKQGEKTRLTEMAGGKPENITSNMIIDASLNGDQFAIELVQEVGRIIGKGLVTILHILNPDIVIIGGTLARSGNILLDSIRGAIRRDAIVEIADDSEICISEMGTLAALKGAYALVMEKIFNEEEPQVSLL